MSEPSESRRQTVDAAREAWTRRLVDTSRRNNLLYFRDLKVGTLDFAGAREGAVEELLMGAKVALSTLVPDDPKATARLEEIVRKARSNREERGLETLYLAYGMATWPVDDGGRPPEAAAVLVPLAVEGKATPMLVRSGVPRANLALLHILGEMGFEPDLDEESEDAATMIGRLQATVPLDGFRVAPRAVVGNFSFQKLAMVRDLQNGDALAQSDLVAALAGDASARALVGGRRVAVEPRTLDDLPPEREFLPLDADSSQQAVVQAVVGGSDGVIQGPPGCGKSQTIANLVATLAAEGKRVLFVAEKRAALEAVLKRLEATGLGHLALDLHGATVSQKAVVARIGETLATIRESPEPDEAALNARFADRRARLIAHDRRMHSPLTPSNRSPYALQAAILGSPIESQTRWRGPDLSRLTSEVATQIEDLLDEASGHPDSLLGRGPWARAKLDDGAAAQAALDAAATLAERLPSMRAAVATLAGEIGIVPPRTFEDVQALLELVDATNEKLEWADPALFIEAADLDRDLRPMTEGPFAAFAALLFNGRYRRARRRFRDLTGITNPSLEVVRDAANLAEAWRERGVAARAATRPPELDSIWPSLSEAVFALEEILPSAQIAKNAELEALVKVLLNDAGSARVLPRVRAIEKELEALGAGRIVEEIRSGGEILVKGVLSQHAAPSPQPLSQGVERGAPWRAVFRDAWTRSCYDAALVELPELAAFSGVAHTAIEGEFQNLDRERTRLAAARVRRAHAEAAVAAMNRYPQQTDAVRAETQKRSRHKPLRRLLAEAPDVLTAVLPCWMASPLNVSGLLPAEPIFDVVVFDEASQVLPEDAIGAVLRGKRLVVAGDRHQLPPTVFFADGGEDEDEDAPTSGFQSLLDGVGAFLDPWPLLWHYRSRDERLIAFSNRFVYGNRLITFPGVGGEPCVEHVLVVPSSQEASPGVTPPSSADEESSSAEVQKVVERVLAHAETSPEVTLGVITMGLRHAMRIEAALDRALDARPELEAFFDPKRTERFFVKNLEQVQGDERDAILISVGYGKDHNGRLPYRFGPLLQEGGERRLNVAVTRARRRMTVVSSFSHLDMDPGRSKARGVFLLREFLQFAASGGTNLGDRGESTVPMNPFEADVYDALAARGVPLTAQYGVSGYRLDFAAAHPESRGRFVLAIECDGASYHSAPTARDRDRLRQQQLEAIGWRFHRIWSTDWFLHREREIDAAVRAWEAACLTEVKGESSETIAFPAVVDSHPPLEEDAEKPRLEPPAVEHRDDIEDVPTAELDSLVRWVCEGGLRTDDEIVDEVADRLGYARVGAKIERTVRAALERVRAVP